MKKAFDLLDKALRLIVIVLAICLVLDVMLQIAGRYFMTQPVSWTEELSRYFLAGIVAFGTPLVARRDQYIRVDMLLNKFPLKVRRIWLMILNLMVAIFLAVTAYYAISYIKVGALQTSPVLNIPMWIIFSSVLVGPALTSLFFLEKVLDGFKELREEGNEC